MHLLKVYNNYIEVCISNRECIELYDEGEKFYSKLKLAMYETFSKDVQLKMYRVSDILLFKLYLGQEHMDYMKSSADVGAECESVTHVLWKCPVYIRSRNARLHQIS